MIVAVYNVKSLEVNNLPIATTDYRQNNLLFSLFTEVFSNLILFDDQSFHDLNSCRVYPRFRHVALDQALVSGTYIFELDESLYSLLYDWAVSLDDINHRLDISEFRDFGRVPESEIKRVRSKIIGSPAYSGSRLLCKRILTYLLENYGDQVGIDPETIFFGRIVKEILNSIPD